MSPRDESIELMIKRLDSIKANGTIMSEIRSYRQKADEVFLPFAESEIQFIDKEHMDEEGAHIVALHEEAFTLRRQCDSLLGSKTLEDSEIASSAPKIRDIFLECCARIDNIVNQRRPDLLTAVDAVL